MNKFKIVRRVEVGRENVYLLYSLFLENECIMEKKISEIFNIPDDIQVYKMLLEELNKNGIYNVDIERYYNNDDDDDSDGGGIYMISIRVKKKKKVIKEVHSEIVRIIKKIFKRLKEKSENNKLYEWLWFEWEKNFSF